MGSKQRHRAHLGKASVIMCHHRGVRAVQLLDNLKALIELSEDVHHRAGEQSMLRCLLKLQTEEQEDIFFTLTQIKKQTVSLRCVPPSDSYVLPFFHLMHRILQILILNLHLFDVLLFLHLIYSTKGSAPTCNYVTSFYHFLNDFYESR